jgi:hypothetical protein
MQLMFNDIGDAVMTKIERMLQARRDGSGRVGGRGT